MSPSLERNVIALIFEIKVLRPIYWPIVLARVNHYRGILGVNPDIMRFEIGQILYVEKLHAREVAISKFMLGERKSIDPFELAPFKCTAEETQVSVHSERTRVKFGPVVANALSHVIRQVGVDEFAIRVLYETCGFKPRPKSFVVVVVDVVRFWFIKGNGAISHFFCRSKNGVHRCYGAFHQHIFMCISAMSLNEICQKIHYWLSKLAIQRLGYCLEYRNARCRRRLLRDIAYHASALLQQSRDVVFFRHGNLSREFINLLPLQIRCLELQVGLSSRDKTAPHNCSKSCYGEEKSYKRLPQLNNDETILKRSSKNNRCGDYHEIKREKGKANRSPKPTLLGQNPVAAIDAWLSCHLIPSSPKFNLSECDPGLNRAGFHKFFERGAA